MKFGKRQKKERHNLTQFLLIVIIYSKKKNYIIQQGNTFIDNINFAPKKVHLKKTQCSFSQCILNYKYTPVIFCRYLISRQRFFIVFKFTCGVLYSNTYNDYEVNNSLE